MFVQVIEGDVSDAASVRGELDQWAAGGWLPGQWAAGSTAGVTDAWSTGGARALRVGGSGRSRTATDWKQSRWEQTATLFIDEPASRYSTSVDVDTPGDPRRPGSCR